MAVRIRRFVSRYFCPTHPNLRVVPYDKMERVLETLAPVKAKGESDGVLLATANSPSYRGAQSTKWGYCWMCEDFVEGTRVTQHELVLRYMQRPNFRSRKAGSKLFTAQAIEAELTSRRRGA